MGGSPHRLLKWYLIIIAMDVVICIYGYMLKTKHNKQESDKNTKANDKNKKARFTDSE